MEPCGHCLERRSRARGQHSNPVANYHTKQSDVGHLSRDWQKVGVKQSVFVQWKLEKSKFHLFPYEIMHRIFLTPNRSEQLLGG